MNTAKQLQSFYTIDDIYSLPEGKRAELIYGELYLMSAPGTKHQEIVMELSYQIRHYIGASKGFCKVYPAPFAVFLNGNDEIYLEPDISVICDKTKVTEEAASARQTGSLKSYPLPAVHGIIIKNCFYTGLHAYGSTGS